MSDSQPPRYENYPDEPPRAADLPSWASSQASGPMAPYVPSGTPAWPTASRRGVVGGVLTAVVVMIVGAAAVSNKQPEGGGFPPDDSGGFPPADPADPNMLELGGQELLAPDGWTIEENSTDRAVLTNGRNQLLIAIETVSGGTAEEELRDAVDREDSPFTGKLGTVKLSERNGNGRATASSTGKFEGKAAHQSVELILDDASESALFLRQILATPTDPVMSKESARLMADFRGAWPW